MIQNPKHTGVSNCYPMRRTTEPVNSCRILDIKNTGGEVYTKKILGSKPAVLHLHQVITWFARFMSLFAGFATHHPILGP